MPRDTEPITLWPRRQGGCVVEKTLMSLPAGWQNPIVVPPGQILKAGDAADDASVVRGRKEPSDTLNE